MELRWLSAAISSLILSVLSESDGAYEDDVKAGFTFNCTFQCTQIAPHSRTFAWKVQNTLDGGSDSGDHAPGSL